MRMTPRVIVKKLIRRWNISSSARCCDRHALLMISWFTTMSQKNVSDNGSYWCSDTTRGVVKIGAPNKCDFKQDYIYIMSTQLSCYQ